MCPRCCLSNQNFKSGHHSHSVWSLKRQGACNWICQSLSLCSYQMEQRSSWGNHCVQVSSLLQQPQHWNTRKAREDEYICKMNTSSNLSDPLCMQTHSEEIRLTSRISRHWSHILALFQNIMCCLAVYSLHRRQPYKAISLWKRNLTSDWFITFYIDRNKQCYLKDVQEFAVSMSLS